MHGFGAISFSKASSGWPNGRPLILGSVRFKKELLLPPRAPLVISPKFINRTEYKRTINDEASGPHISGFSS